jgi:alanine racemase
MKQPSYIELSRSALKKNLHYLKKRIGKQARYVSVIKGNAYGHGIREFIPLAEECGVDYFAVFDAYEAFLALSAKRPESQIMIMGMIEDSELEWAIAEDITFFVFEKERLQSAVRYAKQVGKPARIHLELETGLHRTGFEEIELSWVIEFIHKHYEHIQLEGICTHYAGAESIANYVRVNNQYNKFIELTKMLAERGLEFRFHHTACSAAALTYPYMCMNMVRIGIAQYGFWPGEETRMYNLLSDDMRFTRDPLKRVLKWKTQVMSTKVVEAAQFLSYGHSHLTSRRTKVAAIPIGYYHGYRRSLSNVGHVLIKGRKAPVVGMVNMNMFLVDITSLPPVQKGDEVVIIGEQGKQAITVASFSDASKLVNYELLTRLPAQIPRYIIP